MIWGVRGGYVRLQDGLVMGGYVRLGPLSQPKIAPLNQTPSNKEDNNVVTSNVYTPAHSTVDPMKIGLLDPALQELY